MGERRGNGDLLWRYGKGAARSEENGGLLVVVSTDVAPELAVGVPPPLVASSLDTQLEIDLRQAG